MTVNEKFGRFEYLGFYNLKYKANNFFSKDNDTDITKYYLVVVEKGYLYIASNNLEDIMPFLSEKNLYVHKSSKIFIFQLFLEKNIFIEGTDLETGEPISDILSTDFGIHPLDWKKKTKQIIKLLSEFWV